MKIFIFDPIWEELVTADLREQLNALPCEVCIIKEVLPIRDYKPLYECQEEKLLCLNPDYVSWKLASEDYQDIPNLKAILIASTSTSWVELSAANSLDIPVCNIKGFSTESVAEWAIGMMFSVARQIPMLIKSNFPLDFDKDYLKYRGIELKGKKVGILGLGAIGTAIAERCLGLGMEVIYWSKNSKSKNYTFMDLDDLIRQVDILFPTMAVNEETKNILSDLRLKSMDSRAMLIAVVHNLFNHQLAIEMVKHNKLFGYGYEASPASFHDFEGNVWAAPAYAWATENSMNKSMKFWVDNIINASRGEYSNRVN